MATVPLINGNRYDYASIDLNANGRSFIGHKEISYDDGLEPGEVRGASPQVLARTRGEYSTEASLTMFRQEFDELLDALGDGYMEVTFPISVTYANDGQPTKTDRLVGCRIKRVENSHSQGTDALEVKVDLSLMYILRGGKAPLRNLRR